MVEAVRIAELPFGMFVLKDDWDNETVDLFVKTVTDDLINCETGEFFYGHDKNKPRAVNDIMAYHTTEVFIDMGDKNKNEEDEDKG
jgi:hypothetical protein